MSAKEFVVRNSCRKAEFGIEGYHLVKTNALDKPQVSKIVSGKKTTYIDDAVKSKRNLPDFKYNVMKSMVIEGHKSDMERDIRRTQPV